MVIISEQNKTGRNKRIKGTRAERVGLLLLACLLFMAAGGLQVSASGAKMMYALEKTSVYPEPGTGQEAVGQLEEGEKIFAVELVEEGWYRVVYNGETAYVRQDALALYTSEAGGEENTLVFPDTAPTELTEALAAETLPEESTPGEVLTQESEPERSEASEETPVLEESDGATANKYSAVITGLVLAVGLLAVFAYAAYLILKERNGRNGQDKEEQGEETKENMSAAERKNEDLEFLDWSGAGEEEDQ